MNTIISPDIEKATEVLLNGGILIFPTETVYGIGADSRNIAACQKIYSIKNRPADNPFIVHLDSVESIEKIALIPHQYRDCISHFSPGPITFILEKRDESIFSSGLSTIGVRVPSHSVANSILHLSKIPVSAPSANLSGKPSITRTLDAIEEFNGKVDFILTAEDSEIGIESTVVDLTGQFPTLLRPGRISFFELQKFVPNLIKYETYKDNPLLKPASPGLKYRHYAPNCEVILLKNLELITGDSIAQIGFHLNPKAIFSQKVNTNLEYMHHLYSFFIDCDKKNIRKAFCEYPIPDEFEDVLLNRIQKASMK